MREARLRSASEADAEVGAVRLHPDEEAFVAAAMGEWVELVVRGHWREPEPGDDGDGIALE